MSFRRTINKHESWKLYLSENEELLRATGIPNHLIDAETRFREFLTLGRGTLQDGTVFTLEELTPDEFEHLMRFVLFVVPFDMETTLFEAFEKRRITT